MSRTAPTTAYVEVQIDENAISLTLLSESTDGAVVESTERFRLDKLKSMDGSHLSLHMSDKSQDALVEQHRLAQIGKIFEASDFNQEQESVESQEGDMLYDENAPDWSEDNMVMVSEVTTIPSDQYIIEKNRYSKDKTVADANPSYDPADPVIKAKYVGKDGELSDEYAFPASRLTSE